MARTSVKAVVKAAQREDARARAPSRDQTLSSPTVDSFTNFAQRMGMTADNPMASASYGFNPITRNRVLLEWIHRGSWLGGIAVDTVADDMTRAGIDYVTEIPPDLSERLDRKATSLATWTSINEVIRWGRLYGGAVGVVLVDGQDLRTPLRLETVSQGQYKGMMVLDRWMVEPSLEDLVTDFGPHLGLPKYYRVNSGAPALRNSAVHHSRIAIRHVGIDLPYQQRLMENLWGISVLERLYDRMVAFDSATTGAAQLVYKAYLRTLTVDGLRDIVAAGGPAMTGLTSYVQMMQRFQGLEGITMIDGKDKFEVQGHSAFSGLSDALVQFGQQLSGALQIPLVRLFGQSPAGLNSSGESDLRMYYDHIKQQQMKTLHSGVSLIYKLIALSEGVKLPDNFSVGFKSLWELSDGDKAGIAGQISTAVSGAFEGGLLSQKTALQELRQSSRVTGVFTNITHEMIEAADDTMQPPGADDLLSGLTGGGGGDAPGGGGDAPPTNVAPGQLPPSANQGDLNEAPGQEGQAPKLDASAGRRKPLQQPLARRSPTGGGAGPGAGT